MVVSCCPTGVERMGVLRAANMGPGRSEIVMGHLRIHVRGPLNRVDFIWYFFHVKNAELKKSQGKKHKGYISGKK
jgi:hypothetical protein